MDMFFWLRDQVRKGGFSEVPDAHAYRTTVWGSARLRPHPPHTPPGCFYLSIWKSSFTSFTSEFVTELYFLYILMYSGAYFSPWMGTRLSNLSLKLLHVCVYMGVTLKPKLSTNSKKVKWHALMRSNGTWPSYMLILLWYNDDRAEIILI